MVYYTPSVFELDSRMRGRHLGQEDPSCDNHLISAARYFLTEMVKANADPEAEFRKQERERRDVAAARQAEAANPSR